MVVRCTISIIKENRKERKKFSISRNKNSKKVKNHHHPFIHKRKNHEFVKHENVTIRRIKSNRIKKKIVDDNQPTKKTKTIWNIIWLRKLKTLVNL